IGAVHGVVLPSGVAEGSPCEGTGSEEEVVAVRVGPTGGGAAARRNGREGAAKWGPAWEWRGRSTTVRPRSTVGAGAAPTGGEFNCPSPAGRRPWSGRRMSTDRPWGGPGGATGEQTQGG